MKITTRQLRRIIKEERSRLTEEKKFQVMLLKEEDGGMLQMAFQALKDQGPKIADKMKQWMKANPEIFQELLEEMMEDGQMKDVIKSMLPKGGGDDEGGSEEESAEPGEGGSDEEEGEDEKKVLESLRRRLRARQRRSR